VGHEHRNLVSHASEKAVDMAVDLGDLDVGVTILYDELVRNDSRWFFEGYKPRATPRATFLESSLHAISWQP
jgi:phosphopantetheine adenylyltransferase